MPASQIDDQIIIQQSAWDQTFTVAAKSYHPKGAFIAEIVGFDPIHEFKRAWLGININCMDGSMKSAQFELLKVINKPKLLQIRAAHANFYLLYIDLHNEIVLYPIFSKTEVREWLNAKQLWDPVGHAFDSFIAAGTSMSTSMPIGAATSFSPSGPVIYMGPNPPPQKLHKLPPAKLNIEPPAGKRRIKLG